MFVQFVCFLENPINLGWRVRHKSVSEHLSVPALKQHGNPSESLRCGFPEDLPRVKGECIPELANIVNCNFVEASEGLGHHWNKSKTLPVAIICSR